MKCQSFPFFAVICAWGLSSLHAADETVLDTATIQAITGLKGVSNQTEGTFKVSRPRDDVSVTVEQSHMAPFMGLTSWRHSCPPERIAPWSWVTWFSLKMKLIQL